jgi:serine/threonine protein kinase
MDRELELLQTLKKHPNILTIFGHDYKQEKMYIFCELWFSSLRKIIQNITEESRGYFSRGEVKIIFLDICKALAYLHNLPVKVIHRDVKSQNVLVDRNPDGSISKVALCDFGISKKVDKKPITASVGTARFMAPEVHKGEEYNESVDMWSFGMMILEVLSLKLPYHNIDYLEIKNHVTNRNRPIDAFPSNFDDYKFIFENCTRYTPEERWTSQKCLEYINNLS